MEAMIETIGDGQLIIICGLITGLLFGVAANSSQFCLRAATVELWRGKPGARFAVWLFVFGTALAATQWMLGNGHLDKESVRQLTGTGSLSGAVIGGLIFGAGMVLARGCASRLLVLSATGNLRALVTGLVLTVVAQASLTGVLAPAREHLSSIALIDGPLRDVSNYLPAWAPMLLAAACIILAIAFAISGKLRLWHAVFALLTGSSIALGWYLTFALAQWSFEPVTVQSVTFTGPSANTLMALIYESEWPQEFGFGLVPGVFAGSFLASAAKREIKLQTFDAQSGMVRYMAGAVMMGFGGMLAGGCAVGAGITGGSVMALTAWTALFFMWAGAGLADWLVDRKKLLAAPSLGMAPQQ